MNFKHYFFKQQFLLVIIFMAIAFLPVRSYAQELDSLKTVLKKTKFPDRKADLYNKIANLYLDIDLNKTRLYADSAMFIGDEISDFKIRSNAFVNYANSFYFQGNFDSTLVYYQKSYAEIIKTEDKNEIAASLNRLGLIYEAKSNYSEAAKYYFKALKIYEDTKHKPGLANVYNNLGIINDALGNSEKAIVNYSAALDLFLEINDLDGQANAYNNLATLYADKNELSKAISYIKTAITILKRNNGKSGTATAYYNASTFFEKKGLTDSALQTLDSALVYYKFTENLQGISNVYDKKAFYLTKNQNYLDAINLLLESLVLREKVGNLNATTQTLEQLSETYEKVGNYETALLYFKKYKALQDSVFSKSTKNEISELNIKYETDKKTKAISLLEKESEIRHFENRFLFFLTIALAVISLLLLYSFRTKTKFAKSQRNFIVQREALAKLRAEKLETEKLLLEKEIKTQYEINELQKNELGHSKRELATSTLQILNKNKILSEIKDSFKIIKPNNPQEKEVITNISKKVKDNINLDEDWEQFKMHFEKVNTGFFEKLQTQYPELSDGDLKVCAYIKINLSPKEIAQIMNISIDGINKRLYRIRKKINLNSSENLSSHLAKF